MTLKRHAALWRALANNLGVNTKSLQSFEKRLSEGPPLFYVILPSLGKDLERGLCGQFELSETTQFKKQRGSQLPQFLYELFIKVFDKDGYVRPNNIGRPIKELRQLLMMFYKFETALDNAKKCESMESFISRDRSVKTDNYPMGLQKVREYFLSLLPSNPFDIKPHHSNGASAQPVTNVEKRIKRRYIPSLMGVYPPQFFFNSQRHVHNWTSVYDTVTAEPNARVTLVPKDSRGPRVICMEPHERMFVQKGLMALLYDHIEHNSPAKGYVNFTDQTVNQYLALTSSVDGSKATIDLKDASDMVPWNLIRLLVSPDWFVALKATRSAIAEVDGKLIELNKFAPMGSALCFPIEAMLFWSICRTVCEEVWVYGDDIIVDNKKAAQCIAALESYGLLVNHDKTLTTGLFRESCGGEYYDGYDISYVKCKSYDQMRFIEFANLMRGKFGEVADDLVRVWEHTQNTPIYRLPLTHIDSGIAGAYFTKHTAASSVFFRRRYNEDLQRYEIRRLSNVAVASKSKTSLVDDDFLFDWFTQSCKHIQPTCDSQVERMVQGLFYDDNRRETVLDAIDREVNHSDLCPKTKYTWEWM